MDVVCAEQTKAIGFAGILTIVEDATLKDRKHHGKGESKKRAEKAVAPVGAGIQPYTPMKLPSSRDAYLKEIVVSLEATNAILPSPLCADPMLHLAATLAIFGAMLDSPSVVP